MELVHLDKQIPTNKSILKSYFQNDLERTLGLSVFLNYAMASILFFKHHFIHKAT